MPKIAISLGSISAALFAGGCLYLSLVQLPWLGDLPAAEARRFMLTLLPAMGRLMGPLLLIACACAGYRLFQAHGGPGAAQSIAVFAALAAALLVTAAVHLPINAEYLGGQPLSDARAGLLLSRWTTWHHLRSAFALTALVAALWPGPPHPLNSVCKNSTSTANSASTSTA
jgi:hypothetical protein